MKEEVEKLHKEALNISLKNYRENNSYIPMVLLVQGLLQHDSYQ